MISGTAPVSLGDLQAGVEQRLDGVRGEIRRLIEADFPPDPVESLLDAGLQIAKRNRRRAGGHRGGSAPSRSTRSPRSRNLMSTASARS